jgi:hypothetical protein
VLAVERQSRLELLLQRSEGFGGRSCLNQAQLTSLKPALLDTGIFNDEPLGGEGLPGVNAEQLAVGLEVDVGVQLYVGLVAGRGAVGRRHELGQRLKQCLAARVGADACVVRSTDLAVGRLVVVRNPTGFAQTYQRLTHLLTLLGWGGCGHSRRQRWRRQRRRTDANGDLDGHGHCDLGRRRS